MNDKLSEIGKPTQFSKDNQPTGSAKSEGKLKASFLKSIAEQIITGEFADELIETAKSIGINIVELDVETAMHLKQIQIAIQTGDTKAYSAVLDRLKGKPKQEVASDVRIIGLDSLTNTQIEDEIRDIESRGEDSVS